MKIFRAFFLALYTCFLYAGLPFLGWGLDDVGGFSGSAPRLAYLAGIALCGAWIGWHLIRNPDSVGSGKGREEKFVPRQRLVRIAMTLLLFAGLLFLPFSDRRGIGSLPDLGFLRWSGLALTLAGLGVILWSGFALGRMYSQEVTIQEAHRLITHGPYRFVRHPRYAGVLLLSIGFSLLFRSWIGLLCLAIVAAILLFRIRDEEALMQKEFGAEWEAYSRKTKRLIPLIW